MFVNGGLAELVAEDWLRVDPAGGFVVGSKMGGR